MNATIELYESPLIAIECERYFALCQFIAFADGLTGDVSERSWFWLCNFLFEWPKNWSGSNSISSRKIIYIWEEIPHTKRDKRRHLKDTRWKG